MTAIGQQTLRHAVRAVHQGVAGLEQQLNATDSRLGDGDTGSMLVRVIERLNGADLESAPDLGASFALLAGAAVSATGSSLGTLLATALMTLGKATKGRATVDWPELGGLLAKARDAMLARGGANLGDKTVLDAVHAVAEAIDGRDQPEVRTLALQTAQDTLDRFRAMPCRIGRARMFGEKTVGVDDPGMLAFAELTRCLAA